MRDPIILLVHLIATLARLMGPGGLRSVVAESLLVKHQLLILNRSRHRAPNLRVSDRILAGVCALFMRPARVFRSAIVLRPSTILNFHRTLRQRKYRLLFSPKRRRTGPKGPPKDLVDAIVDMKRRNPRWGCPADRTTRTWCADRAIDRLCGRRRIEQGTCSGASRRVLATPWGARTDAPPLAVDPSWLWRSMLEPCEGRALCRMVNHAIRGLSLFPKHLSSDHESAMARQAMRVLQVTECKDRPFVERLTRCARIVGCSGHPDLEDKLVNRPGCASGPVPYGRACERMSQGSTATVRRALPRLSDSDRESEPTVWRAWRRARLQTHRAAGQRNTSHARQPRTSRMRVLKIER